MTWTYEIGNGKLYINVTNRCTNNCAFCNRSKGEFTFRGFNLKLDREPTAEEIITEIKNHDLSKYKGLVFCGFGEPLLRINTVEKICREIKDKNVDLNVRINTNGLANWYHGENVLRHLKGVVDEMNISLNADNPESYDSVCSPDGGKESFYFVLQFIREAANKIARVSVSYVSVNDVDKKLMKQIIGKDVQIWERKYMVR